MKLNKPMLIAGAASVLVAAGLLGTQVASAHDNDASLADKVATRFNVKSDDVQKVLDENRDEHKAEHKAKFTERLDQAVKDGKISITQRDAIIAKLESLKSQREDLRDKSHEERHDAMEQKREELAQWAKDNNIPEDLLMPMHGGGARGHGFKR